MKRTWAAGLVGSLLLGATAWGQSETHANLQAVNASGVSTWAGTHPFTIRGVILNDPEEMLDFTWDSGAESGNRMGAQWQMFFQTVAGDDCGGTASWMGQNYNSMVPYITEGHH